MSDNHFRKLRNQLIRMVLCNFWRELRLQGNAHLGYFFLSGNNRQFHSSYIIVHYSETGISFLERKNTLEEVFSGN